MSTTTVPSRQEILDQIYSLSTQEVLGSYEAITLAQKTIVPHLMSSGYDTTDLAEHLRQSALGSAWNFIDDFIRREKHAVIEIMAQAALDDAMLVEVLFCRASAIQLMKLLISARIHHDIAIV